MNIDITELLEEYVRLLEKSGLPRESTESKLMIEAVEEIKKLRSSLDFQIRLADDNNNSRLRLQDVIVNCMNLYEKTCKDIRKRYNDESVCGICDNDYGCLTDEDCFKLDVKKFNDIVFEKKTRQARKNE